LRAVTDQKTVLGRNVVAVVKDDQGKADVAAQVARELRDAKVAGVVGHLFTAATLAGLSEYARDSIPVLPPVASIPEPTSSGFPNLIALGAPPERQAGIGAIFLSKKLALRAVILFVEEGAFGDRILAGLTAVAKQQGMELKGTERFPQNTLDFSALLARSKPRLGEGAFFSGTPSAARAFLKVWPSVGAQSPLVLASAWGLRPLPSELGDVEKGVYFIGLDYPAESATTQQLLKAWEAKAPKDTRLPDLFVYGYAAIQVLLHGIAKAGTTDGKKVVDAIIKNTNPTVAGPFKFTPNRESTRATYSIFELKGGAYVLAQSTGGGDCCPDYAFCCALPPPSLTPPAQKK